jgi:hypothetical protein
MKDKEPKLEEIEASHTLGGAVIHTRHTVQFFYFYFLSVRGNSKRGRGQMNLLHIEIRFAGIGKSLLE